MLHNRPVRLISHHHIGTQLNPIRRIPDRYDLIRTITGRIILHHLERRHHTLIKRRNRSNGTNPIRNRQNRQIPTITSLPRRTPFRTVLHIRQLLENTQQRLIRRPGIRPITTDTTRRRFHLNPKPMPFKSSRHEITHDLTLVTIRIRMIANIHGIQIMFDSGQREGHSLASETTFAFDHDATPQYRRPRTKRIAVRYGIVTSTQLDGTFLHGSTTVSLVVSSKRYESLETCKSGNSANTIPLVKDTARNWKPAVSHKTRPSYWEEKLKPLPYETTTILLYR